MNTSLNKTIGDFIEVLSKKYRNKVALIFKSDFRTHKYTYSEIYHLSQKLITYFQNEKISKGDKIIIWHYNSPEWIVIMIACAISGVIAVPLDFNSDAAFIKKIQQQTKAKKIFTSIYKSTTNTEINKKIIFTEELFQIISNYKLNQKKFKLKPQDILQIVYTSGTTSAPKGVLISHQNIIANINSLKRKMKPDRNSVYLSLIPLSHLLEQVLGFWIPLRFGHKIVYPSSRKSNLINKIILEEKITSIVTVPAFLEILKNKIEEKVQNNNKTKIFKKILQLPSFFKKTLLQKDVKLLKTLKYFIVGGSALDINTELFWNQLGVTVLQGYGMTEASPIITCNTKHERKVGTVGKVLPNQEIKLSTSNEILTRGNNIFEGYYNNSSETQKVLQKNWLHTGDIGHIDNDGFLTLKGRIKNIILSDNGLNIYPEDIEKEILKIKTINDCCVIGLQKEKKIIITAVVIAKEKNNKKLLQKINKFLPDKHKVQNLVFWVNQDFPRTPSLKIKRSKIEETIKNNVSKSSNISTPTNFDPLIQIISKISGIHSTKISLSHNLYTDLNIDSLARVQLTSEIEDAFEIELNEEEINTQTTVKTLKKLIKYQKGHSNKNSFNYWSFNFFIRYLRIILQIPVFIILKHFCKVNVYGLNRPHKINQPVIFAVNHTSHFDTPILLMSLPIKFRLLTAVAAAEDYFFENTQTKYLQFKILWLRTILNIFPFSRTTKIRNSLKRTGQIIDKNHHIVLYPEGTRTKNGQLQPFMQGIGLLANQMQAPIIPVKITGLYDILPKGSTWPIKKGPVKVKFGKLYTDINKSTLEITKDIESIINKL